MAIRQHIHSEAAARFWQKVEIVPFHACWEWTAAKNEAGYGIFGLGKATDKAPRISWRLTYGDIPPGLVVCHKCDNPGCVRPEHLFLGTHKDNHDDAVKKKRSVAPPPMGGWNKKDIPQACIDLLGTRPDTELGKQFSLHKCVIARERRRRGITPFPCQTRFKVGAPHPRWSRKGGVHAR